RRTGRGCPGPEDFRAVSAARLQADAEDRVHRLLVAVGGAVVGGDGAARGREVAAVDVEVGVGADVVDRGGAGFGVLPLGPAVPHFDEEGPVAVDDVVAVLGPGRGGVLVAGGAMLEVAGLLCGEPRLVVGEVGRVALAAVAEVPADEDDGVPAGLLVEGGAGVPEVLE